MTATRSITVAQHTPESLISTLAEKQNALPKHSRGRQVLCEVVKELRTEEMREAFLGALLARHLGKVLARAFPSVDPEAALKEALANDGFEIHGGPV